MSTSTANFELRLYEGQNRFDVVYGDTAAGNTSATAGVQNNDICFAQYFCNGDGGPPAGGWTVGPAGTPSPTPTATATLTPTATAQLLNSRSQRNANGYCYGYYDSHCRTDGHSYSHGNART